MKPRLLHSVIDDILAAAEQWPELAADILHFVFDATHDVRPHLYCEQTSCVADSSVVVETLAADRLVQFAHAVTRGFIPHVMPAGGA
ncbi:MAG: hypothetical protein EPN57_20470 [Paraburkholderia sp.]|nr:MAG: hypothetical protein EPN57_20470 [Paraburkholderia sp.]